MPAIRLSLFSAVGPRLIFSCASLLPVDLQRGGRSSRQRWAFPPCGCRCRRSLSGSWFLSVAWRETSQVSRKDLSLSGKLLCVAHLPAPGTPLRPSEVGSLIRSLVRSGATSSCRASWRPLGLTRPSNPGVVMTGRFRLKTPRGLHSLSLQSCRPGPPQSV